MFCEKRFYPHEGQENLRTNPIIRGCSIKEFSCAIQPPNKTGMTNLRFSHPHCCLWLYRSFCYFLPPMDFCNSSADLRNSSAVISLKNNKPCVVLSLGLSFW